MKENSKKMIIYFQQSNYDIQYVINLHCRFIVLQGNERRNEHGKYLHLDVNGERNDLLQPLVKPCHVSVLTHVTRHRSDHWFFRNQNYGRILCVRFCFLNDWEKEKGSPKEKLFLAFVI